MPKENTMNKISETEQVLVNFFYIIETGISSLTSLGGGYFVLKKVMEDLKCSLQCVCYKYG